SSYRPAALAARAAAPFSAARRRAVRGVRLHAPWPRRRRVVQADCAQPGRCAPAGHVLRVPMATSTHSGGVRPPGGDKVQEEVLYREALAMGLDKDDTIVKRRMAQKMQFLAEDVAAAREPTTPELKSWYERNTEKFAQPSRFSFRHLYFSPD